MVIQAACAVACAWSVWYALTHQRPFEEIQVEIALEDLKDDLEAQGAQVFIIWPDQTMTVHSRN